jgi:hypothetical protein
VLALGMRSMPAPQWYRDLPRPHLMAIGDSLLNGMRSYSIDNHLAAHSIPAFLGRSLQAATPFEPFVASTYPAPVLVNVEDVLKRRTDPELPSPVLKLFNLWGQKKDIMLDIQANALAWYKRFDGPAAAGSPVAFHNLALAGACAEDMFDVTLRQIEVRLAAMRPVVMKQPNVLKWKGPWLDGANGHDDDGWNFGDLHMAINARHLRNPGNRDGLEDLTVLDMVAARRPRILLVNLGPNHGLVDIVMRYRGQNGLDGLRKFAAGWANHARELARLPEVEVIIIQLLPLPSQTPCMTPPRNDLTVAPPPPGGGGYHGCYVSAFDIPPAGGDYYTASDAKQLDAQVADINGLLRAGSEQAFKGSGKRLVVVSLADMLRHHDVKHGFGPRLQATGTTRDYDNYPITLDPGGTRRLTGGLCGLDHIHPTPLGYRYIAEQIRAALDFPSEEIEIRDDDDDFLTKPHRPTLEMLVALLPFTPPHVFEGLSSFSQPASATPKGAAILELLLGNTP